MGIEGVQGAGGGGSYSPEELQRYREDYQKGLKIFSESFQKYSEPSTGSPQQQAFKKAMDEALAVMNETAVVALRREQQQKETLLNTDYQAFLNHPTPNNRSKVMEDLNRLRS